MSDQQPPTGSPLAISDWMGDFGREYIQRNPLNEAACHEATQVFRRILGDRPGSLGLESILEVGANIGIQLHGMRQYVGKEARLSAVEPNPLGCKTLRESTALGLDTVVQADARSIPFQSDSMDLVYTRGVLIHIEPDHLPVVMREITRVSRRFVLCLEYFSHKLTEVHYRGMSSRLWKQDFGRRYLENCPDLKVHSYGFIWQVEFPHNDDLNWWLFEKKDQDSK